MPSVVHKANSTLIALWSVKGYACARVCSMKANNQILGLTYGIDISADGWESHLDLDPRTLVSKRNTAKADKSDM